MTAYRMPDPVVSQGRRKRSVGAKVLLVLGLLMLVGAAIAFTAGTHQVADSARKLSDRADQLRQDLALELDVPGQRTVRLGAGRYNIYDVDALSRAANEPIEPATTVSTTTTPPVVTDGPTGPDGQPAPGSAPSTTVPFNRFPDRSATVTITDATGYEVPQTGRDLSSFADSVGGDLRVQGQFRIERPGTYTVDAVGIGGGKVGIGAAGSTSEVGRAVGGAFLTIAALLLGGLGFLATIAGLIWLLVSGSSGSPPAGPPVVGWAAPYPESAGPPAAGYAWTPPAPPTGWPPPSDHYPPPPPNLPPPSSPPPGRPLP